MLHSDNDNFIIRLLVEIISCTYIHISAYCCFLYTERKKQNKTKNVLKRNKTKQQKMFWKASWAVSWTTPSRAGSRKNQSEPETGFADMRNIWCHLAMHFFPRMPTAGQNSGSKFILFFYFFRDVESVSTIIASQKLKKLSYWKTPNLCYIDKNGTKKKLFHMSFIRYVIS